MDYDGNFVMQKAVDWSLLNDGMTIPTAVCSLFAAWDETILTHYYFTRSQNNDSTNIIIISPNYHRIIHRNNPRFNRRKFQFEFENGEVMRLKAAVKREENGTCSNYPEREQARPKVKLYEHLRG